MKTFLNLLLIFSICLVSFGVDVSYAPISLESESLAIDTSIKGVSILSYDNLTPNPLSLNFVVHTESEVSYISSSDFLFKLDVKKGDEIVKSLDIVPYEGERPYEYIIDETKNYQIDISNAVLGLDDGSYKLVISSYLSPDIANLSVDVSYETDIKYTAALNEVPAGKFPFLVYAPSNDYKCSLPVTVFLDESPNSLTKIATAMKRSLDPKYGLITTPLIGDYNYVVLKNKTIFVDIKSKDSLYTKDAASSKAIMNTFIDTLSYYYPNVPIRFLVDYKRSNQYFFGADTSKTIEANHLNEAFLVLKDKPRSYLVPVKVSTINSSESIQVMADKTIEVLKAGNQTFVSSLNSNFKYTSISLSNGILQVNIADDIVLKDLDMDSIGFSLKSLKDVKQVDLIQKGATIKSYTDKTMINPLQ